MLTVLILIVNQPFWQAVFGLLLFGLFIMRISLPFNADILNFAESVIDNQSALIITKDNQSLTVPYDNIAQIQYRFAPIWLNHFYVRLDFKTPNAFGSHVCFVSWGDSNGDNFKASDETKAWITKMQQRIHQS